MNVTRRNPASTTPTAPVVDITTTKEFQDAVTAAAMKAVAEMMAKTQSPGGDASTGSPDELMSKLAMAIAELTDQGTGQKRLPPEEVIKRRAAHERMGRLIIDAKQRGAKPRYRVMNKIYLNERFIEPYSRDSNNKTIPTIISWTGVPNEYLYPLDDDAEDISAAFKESIGSTVAGPAVAVKPMWMTSNGLVIEGNAASSSRGGLDHDAFQVNDRRTRPASTSSDHRPVDDRFGDDLGIATANDPRAEFVNILGTVAPPARQNNADIQR